MLSKFPATFTFHFVLTKEKGNIVLKNIGNESTPGTLAGSPPLGGSNSLGLSSFEDRFSSLTTSCVSHTLAIKSNYLKSINTCDEEHPSVSRIISNEFHRSKVLTVIESSSY